MTGRHTKLNPKLQKDLAAALATGATIADACAAVDIHTDTYFDWVKRGEENKEGDAAFSEFSDAVRRAQAQAKALAILTVNEAMKPYTETTTTVQVYEQTRLRDDVDPATGKKIQVEYTYTEKTTKTAKTRRKGDAHYAVEFLRRRHKAEWGDNVDMTSGGQPVAINFNRVPARAAPPVPKTTSEDLDSDD